LGLKRWIKRAICPVTPDAPDVDVLRLPDQQVEAMANPEAYLDRVGRSDLDMGSKPPMRSAQLDYYLRAFSQPGRRALDLQAHEHSRISARGGLRILKCVHRISLGENVIARAVATNSATGQVAAASGHGAYSIDILRGVAEHIGRRSNLNHLSFSKSGMLAVTNDKHQLSVFDCNGAEIVKRRTPYSAWKRVTGTRGDFETPSWSADEKRIAIGASDRIWIYNLDDDKFEQVALHQDGQINSASALFIPESDDLLIMHMWKIWRVSWRTGKIGQQLDIWAGSDFFEAKPEVTSMKQAGFDPNCLALSPDGRFLAIGGNDAQLVLADAKTLQPAALRVWHAPLVEGRQNGKIEALAFSPDGCKLASVANDSRLIVGDARSGDPLADGILSRELASHGIPVEHDVCWSVAGAQIVVVNSEGSIEVWDNGPDLI
jgi:WD40 repeat protein